jgi:hypothetical protein
MILLLPRPVRAALKPALVSLLLLLPCVWQPRIQAGDLSSHLYNAWLAQLVEQGQASGITVVPQFHNVLFDCLLLYTWRAAGPRCAEVVPVALSVLVLFWGAFAWIRRVNSVPPWRWVPCLAMLAYGWVFRTGFFNFHLSLGLCLGALALAWDRKPARLAAAGALLLLAITAHALPVAWAAGLFAYDRIFDALAPGRRWMLLLAGFAALASAGAALTWRFDTQWGLQQLRSLTGADQLFISGPASILLMVLLAAFCFVLLNRQVVAARGQMIRSDVRLHFFLLSAASIVLLPNGVLLPGYAHALLYIADRMSLCVALSACLLLARAPFTRAGHAVLASIACLFFAVSYVDEREANRIEDAMTSALASLPPGQRVLSALPASPDRIELSAHAIDRACIGRCFSYANYEPCSRAFRVRTLGPNRVAAATYADAWAMQSGTYVIRPADTPIFGLFPRPGPDPAFELRPLRAGQSLATSPASPAAPARTRTSAPPGPPR